MIPVLGFAVYSQFDKADRLLASIDYPVRHLVIVDNSGTQSWEPKKPDSVEFFFILRMPYGIGLVGAWNLVIKSTPYAPYWVLINDDAWFESGALQIIAEQADPTALNFVDIIPEWSCLVFGEEAIAKAGLYDERFYPLYFDDNDLHRRMIKAGVKENRIPAKIHHENSSSLSGKSNENNRTYSANQNLNNKKISEEDFSAGYWDLGIRRANRWD
jgi:GT2 family glycosyltransferase